MKVHVNAIMPEGMDLEEVVEASELGIEAPLIHYSQPIKIKAHVEKDKDILRIDCKIEGLIRQTCSRCLCEFDSPIDKKAGLIHKLGNEHTVELKDDIKDTIMLDYPIRILCKEDCKGLCAQCGENLNEGTCKCKKNGVSSIFL